MYVLHFRFCTVCVRHGIKLDIDELLYCPLSIQLVGRLMTALTMTVGRVELEAGQSVSHMETHSHVVFE